MIDRFSTDALDRFTGLIKDRADKIHISGKKLTATFCKKPLTAILTARIVTDDDDLCYIFDGYLVYKKHRHHFSHELTYIYSDADIFFVEEFFAAIDDPFRIAIQTANKRLITKVSAELSKMDRTQYLKIYGLIIATTIRHELKLLPSEEQKLLQIAKTLGISKTDIKEMRKQIEESIRVAKTLL